MNSVWMSASLEAPLSNPTSRKTSVTTDEATCIHTTRMKAGVKSVRRQPIRAVRARNDTETGLIEFGTTIVRNIRTKKDHLKQTAIQGGLGVFSAAIRLSSSRARV